MYIKEKIIKKDSVDCVISLIMKDAKRKRKHHPIQIPLEYSDIKSLERLNNIVKTHINDVLTEDLYLGSRDIPEIYYIALNRPTGRIFEVYGIVYTTKDYLVYFNKVSGELVFHIPNKAEATIPLYNKLKEYFYRSIH